MLLSNKEPAMSTTVEHEVEQVLDGYAEAKNRHDVQAAVALCHPDACYESVGLPGRVRGSEALTAFYTRLFALLPDYRADFDGRAIAGHTAVAWGRFTGTISEPLFEGAPVGRRVEVPVTFVCTFRDGLVYSDTGYFDAASLYGQAGLQIPSPEASTQAATFVARFAELWSAPEPERFRDLLHPDTRNLYPGMTEPQGPDGIVDWLKNAISVFPDLKLRVARWATDGEAVLIEFDASATVDGRPMTWQGADRFILEGDRCIEGRSYFDTGPLRRALEKAPAR
jgi:limonene-1,2-epoxide hydrolase